jgi:hypothetical protein
MEEDDRATKAKLRRSPFTVPLQEDGSTDRRMACRITLSTKTTLGFPALSPYPKYAGIVRSDANEDEIADANGEP